VISGIVILLAGAVILGALRWNSVTKALRARLQANRVPVKDVRVNFHALGELPGPVRRFFRTVLTDGQPVVIGLHLQHSGTFNMGEETDNWKRFTSDQRVITQRPGFDWNGRIRMLPGLPGVSMMSISVVKVCYAHLSWVS
jgi:hypothetical protein